MKISRKIPQLYKEYWETVSRDNFHAYRQYINYPKFKKGTFPSLIAKDLQSFYDDMVAGLRPILIIEAPPQHGKSCAITDFVSWFLGKQPENKIIYSSFSDRLGIRANRALQRVFDSEKHKAIFPDFKIGGKRVVTVSGSLLRNNEIIETDDGGFFRNTTINGSITGEGLDLGIIDDPIKGRKTANSKTVRDSTWDWLTDDFMTRFSEYAGMIMILTRWHIDDPAGRLIDQKPDNLTVRSYPAINEDGTALFPEHKSLTFLQKIKKAMRIGNWLALFMQKPVITGGNIVKSDWWKWGEVLPKIKYRFIVADTAQKKNNWNDYTVLQCWGMDWSGNIHLLDMFRKRLTSPELRKESKDFYDRHNCIKNEPLRGMWIEDKSSGSGLIQELQLHKMKIEAVQRSVDKISRADDAGPEIKSGKVFLYKTVKDVDVIVEEASAFPNGVNDDAFDCTMTAIEVGLMGSNHVDYAGLL
jgi:predicted phage terminase large subunit-like protein